jgi:flagellar motility protein MotE (MotC chaperone)
MASSWTLFYYGGIPEVYKFGKCKVNDVANGIEIRTGGLFASWAYIYFNSVTDILYLSYEQIRENKSVSWILGSSEYAFAPNEKNRYLIIRYQDNGKSYATVFSGAESRDFYNALLPCVKITAPQSKKTLQCVKCGAAYADGNFCEKCGAKLKPIIEIEAQKIEAQEKQLTDLEKKLAVSEKKLADMSQKLKKRSDLYYRLTEAAKNHTYDSFDGSELSEDIFMPSVMLNLQYMNSRDLRKRFNAVMKQIEDLAVSYEAAYTLKTNAVIYKLMVMALNAELQNILYELKYGKLEQAKQTVWDITHKYFVLVTDGNQTIAPTLNRFIRELEVLFTQAVEIEYEWYIQKEREREEQRAIREQMREEAADRKRLEEEKRKLEAEDKKYEQELANISEQIETAEDESQIEILQARISELEALRTEVEAKKDEIIKRHNGQAGNVYVISNLGSFGETVFKIGMTRRLDPQERIDELGDASVPFPFDVHCLIFSENASDLERAIHKRLNNLRVNKVNLRKEFFRIDLDDLENLVLELQPSAAFSRTLIAQQYRESLSIDTPPERLLLEASEEDEDEAGLAPA